MDILALDLSSRTGWARSKGFDAPRHGVWRLDGDLGRRCSALAAALEDELAFPPDLVIVEAPLPAQAQGSTDTARNQFGLAAVAEMICHERGVTCEEASAIDVRRLVMGKAKMDKAGVMAWCRAQGWAPRDDNAADALALLRYRHTLDRSRVMA